MPSGIDPFVAQIAMFPFNFAPKGWAFCDGQILPISQNTALFSLLGTFYGGDGKSTFALPDMQGRCPIHHGQGPGLSIRDLGEVGGSETVSLILSEIPFHTHSHGATSVRTGNAAAPTTTNAIGAYPAASTTALYSSSEGGNMAPLHMDIASYTDATGGDQPHNNMQPFLTVNFCIALQGIFPPRP